MPPLVDGGSITVPTFGAFSTGAMAGADWEAQNRQGDDALEWENEQMGTFPGPWLATRVACSLENIQWCCTHHVASCLSIIDRRVGSTPSEPCSLVALHTCDDRVADVEVAQDAAQVINGADPQLEAAVVVVLEELEKNPPPPPHALQPPEPVRSKL